MSEIQEQNYQIEVTKQEQIENFLVPLSFVGVIDNEMFTISQIDILFDEHAARLRYGFTSHRMWRSRIGLPIRAAAESEV